MKYECISRRLKVTHQNWAILAGTVQVLRVHVQSQLLSVQDRTAVGRGKSVSFAGFMFLPQPLQSEFEKRVINFKSPFVFNLDQLQLALKSLVSTKWRYKEVRCGGEEALGSVMAFHQLKVIVKLCHEGHYAQGHSREPTDTPVLVFIVKLNLLHFND